MRRGLSPAPTKRLRRLTHIPTVPVRIVAAFNADKREFPCLRV